MKFLEYLFFKYYYFQVRVGDGVVAEYSALLFICFIIEFIYLDILSTYFFFFPSSKNYSGPGIQSIIINKAKWKGKKTLGAVLFAVLPFVVFFFELYIKMLMNQGKL